jgi:hypothetical protein
VTETQVDLQTVKTSFETRTKDMKNTREETMACQEKTEVRLGEEEPTSVEMKPEVAHEEVPVEDAAMTPVGKPRKRRRDRRHRAAGRRQKKEQKGTLRKNVCKRFNSVRNNCE